MPTIKTRLHEVPQYAQFQVPDRPDIEMKLMAISAGQRGWTYKCRFIDPELDKFFKTISLPGSTIVLMDVNSIPPNEAYEQ